jgi:ribonuclease P protein subunit RPR2
MAVKGKKQEKEGSRKDIEKLFSMAKEARQELADRYVSLARKMASRSRVSLRKYNRVHCRKCSTYFSAKTLRVRTHPSYVSYTCLKCDHTTRIMKK